MKNKTTNTATPERRADILVENMTDETMLYHPDLDELHVLNPTAHLIWELCDGQHNLAEITAQMQVAFQVPDHIDLMGDVERTVSGFIEKRLLVELE
ncbi:MAG: PqqD family protein [Chloroflexota bacterium]